MGFARAIHAGLAAAGERELTALVNDDLAPEPGWLARLVAAIDSEPDLVAVQGVNLDAAAPERTDGCGIAWNRWWQAIQIGHGRPAPPAAPVVGVGLNIGNSYPRPEVLPAMTAGTLPMPSAGLAPVAPLPHQGLASEQVFELDRPLREARDAFEKSYFEFHLAKENGSMTRVAEKTGLERTHLYRKLKQLGVDLSRNKRGSGI